MFLFGIGPSGQSDEQLQAHVAGALRKLANAGVKDAALQLPPRLPPDTGVRTLIDEMHGPGRAVVFAPEPQRMIAALSKVARGAARVEQRTVKVQSSAPLASGAEPPIAPALESEPPPEEATTRPGRKPVPAPPQRYVPVEPKQNVFKKKKR
jgi:hypothetical protein